MLYRFRRYTGRLHCSILKGWERKNQGYEFPLTAFVIAGRLVYWCSLVESNHSHKDFQSFALPTELEEHLVRPVGIEPTRL